MIDHLDLAVRDVAASRAFYAAVLAPLGYVPLLEIERPDGRHGTGFGPVGGRPQFFIGGGTPPAGRLHFAFSADARDAVHRFHAAALAVGAEDRGAPGPRTQYSPTWYAAYVCDPDGHTIEAVCHRAELIAGSR
jgi:catechol 2,3-dioxygenase-like lactoylglutathione lyase family enzyme